MITRIKELPDNMVGFLATDEVSGKDFIDVVMPEVEKFIEEKDKLNYMLVMKQIYPNLQQELGFKTQCWA
ncbi:hypothetical protein [Cloacibacterium caeni]|uniref:hypothetical protein n=1 Tax=Cloacibacterium caeni TaxID=2004710 RepID=UPI0020207AFC|nr:hypothetical protein [Cloacibacterium caeni]